MTVRSSLFPFKRASRFGLALSIGALVASAASADDLSVYTAGLTQSMKPNVLLVLDFSGSMARDINNNKINISGEPAKIDILRDAVDILMQRGGDEMNLGLGPLYSYNSGGIQWPVSDVRENAGEVDPDITANSLLGSDVISMLLEDREVRGGTATVPALAEAGMYFRGGNVYSGGISTDNTHSFTPQQWNGQNNRYEGGHALAPHPATYQPNTAYQYDAPNANSFGTCRNYEVSDGTNLCEGIAIDPSNCTFVPGNNSSSALSALSQSHHLCTYPTEDLWSSANYTSPINHQCQDNFVILISDGEPTVQGNFDAIKDITGSNANACENIGAGLFGDGTRKARAANCGYEVARNLAGGDQNPEIPGSNVVTYTVGFAVQGPGQQYLMRLAEEGQGEFFEANRPEELAAALLDILDEILVDSESFSAASIDINNATFSHDNRVYLPLFKPGFQPSWQGNVKGYYMGAQGLLDVQGNPATISENNNTLIRDEAHSFWSLAADGNNTIDGGVNDRLVPENRNLYTFTGNNIPAAGVDLNNPNGNHELSADNDNVTFNALGIPQNAALRNDLLNWIKNQPIGAPLHSTIESVNYAGGRRVLFSTTNQGFLHAFDASRPNAENSNGQDGANELFAFMPGELLDNLHEIFTGVTTKEHIYGLDGPSTVWHTDTNSNGVVDNNEEALLIFGMRRGGNNYYAMDISNPENPQLKWQIKGGQGEFADLAQTWSRASLISVERGGNGNSEQVLVFGGGYDDALDDLNKKQASSGNAIFMVDRDGDLIWKGTHPDMDYAIPSNITTLDTNTDGMADRLYFGDHGGQVWRVDFGNVNQSGEFEVHKMADLGKNKHQPFFYAPSVAFHALSSQKYLTVSIGSGNRDNPMDSTTNNTFFVLQDSPINNQQTAHFPLERNDLYNATFNDLGANSQEIVDTATEALNNASGWFIDLLPGEKSLSELVTFNGNLLATTFQPDLNPPEDVCALPGTLGRFYMLDVTNGKPVTHLGQADDSVPLNKNHRSEIISTNGIPSSPQIVFPEGDNVKILVDKELVGEIDQELDRIYWFAEQ